MRIKQNFPTCNALIYLRTESSERKKRSGTNKKKIREIKSGSPFAQEGFGAPIKWRRDDLTAI
jgi:hypothetical protein